MDDTCDFCGIRINPGDHPLGLCEACQAHILDVLNGDIDSEEAGVQSDYISAEGCPNEKDF